MGPLAIAGIGAGLNLFNRLLTRQAEPGMVDPSEYRRQLIPNFMAMRNQALQNISQANMANTSRIQQMGAAGRLPAGAVNAMLQGQAYQTGRAAASIEPQLQQLKADSFTNYLGLMNRFRGAQEEARRMNGIDLGADIGGLTKIMLMQKMGMFDLDEKKAGPAAAGAYMTPGLGIG